MADRAIKVRAGHKARVTSLLKKLDEAYNQPNVEEAWMKTQLEEIKHQQATILNLDESILEICTDIESEINTASDFRITVNQGLEKAMLWLNDKKPTSSCMTVPTKLPNITLPRFDGDPLNWTAFWDLFKASIHHRQDLSEASKFYYLIGQLDGEAKLLLADFSHTENNYKEAVQLLERTYGKTKLIIQCRIHAILDLTCTEATSAAVSRFRSKFEGNLRGLKSLGVNIDESGYLYAVILLRKLPSAVQSNIYRASSSPTWCLDELRSSIEREIELLRAAEEADGDAHLYRTDQQSGRENFSTISVGANNHNSQYKGLNSTTCALCNGNHSVFQCTNYVSPSSKRSRVSELGLRYNCFRTNHLVVDCKVKVNCKFCNKRHHTTLCDTGIRSSDVKPSAINSVSTTNDQPSTNESSCGSLSTINVGLPARHSSILPMATLKLRDTHGSVMQARCLFDTGSQETCITKDLCAKLGCQQIGVKRLRLEGINSKTESKDYPVVSMSVESNVGLIQFQAMVIDHLPNSILMHGRDDLLSELSSHGVVVACDERGDLCKNLQILVGIDNYFKFIYAETTLYGAHIIPSRIGNIIAGSVPCKNVSENSTATVLEVTSYRDTDADANLNQTLAKCWETDHIGISSESLTTNSIIEDFNNSVVYENGKYTVALPWKLSHPELPTNLALAYKRLKVTLDKLKAEDNMLQKYNSLIQEQIDSDFIEEVTDESSELSDKKLHYLSHHAIFKDSKTTPIRIVFDCSAKCSKHCPSLNDCLYSGPSLINDLCSVLQNFRLGKFACTADICKAFLQVGLREEDRDCTRFLWPVNPFDTNSRIATYRFEVVLFGATCSQFLLNATVLHHLQSIPHPAAKAIKDNIYVDNVQNSFDKEEDMVDFYYSAKTIMSNAGFPLKQWNSNSVTLNQIAGSNGDLSDDGQTTKVLGIVWNTKSDTLSINFTSGLCPNASSKRTMVSELSKVYDPLGFVLPITIKGRIFIQKIWKSSCNWDEPLESELVDEYQKLIQTYAGISKISMQRQIYIAEDVVLNIFCDASTLAYGSVAYITGKENSYFIMAKGRVAPIKTLTLPRLELTAITLACRLQKFIKAQFTNINITATRVFSDSTVALSWIKSEKKLDQFVQNRVNEIREIGANVQFKHISGIENPADILTRGISVDQFNLKVDWWSGPEWLLQDKNVTIEQVQLSMVSESDSVECPENVKKTIPSDPKINLINFDKFSSYDKLLRAAATVIMASNKFLCAINKKSELSKLQCTRLARILLIKLCQMEEYHEVISFLKGSRQIKAPSIVRQLRLYLDSDGVIRCRGRMENSDSNLASACPILLPRNSCLTRLLITHVHAKSAHFGVNYVLSELKRDYWFPKARQTIKNLLRKCVPCKKVHGRPFKMQQFAPLPAERVTKSRPFQITGVDYTGVMYVKNGNGARLKVYVVLFTCATTRAIHLELVDDCTELEFLNAFRRFTARRSIPSIIISDNATTFEAANKTLQQICNDDKVQGYLNAHNIEWKFIIKRAPWTGGFYERLIGITKNSLRKVVGNACLSLKEFQTLLPQIECRINDRPLTYISSDSDELEALTPSRLIYGYNLGTFPDDVNLDILIDPSYNSREVLHRFSINLTTKLNNLWVRWRDEYLTSLRERHINEVRGSGDVIRLGEVVLIQDDMLPRSRWRLGVITELFKSKDGVVRSVGLRTCNGNTNRPIVKLYPLEISDAECEYEKDVIEDKSSNERPRRYAANDALLRIRKLLNE